MLGAAGAESAQRRPAAGAGAAGTEAEAHLHGPGETVRPSSCWQKEAAGFQGQLPPSSTRFMGRELGAKRGLQPMGEPVWRPSRWFCAEVTAARAQGL